MTPVSGQQASRHPDPPESRLAICGATDIGTSRTTNQDTFVIADLRSGDLSNPCSRTDIPLSWQGILLLVCDGMGGAAAGELAARIASEVIDISWSPPAQRWPSTLTSF